MTLPACETNPDTQQTSIGVYNALQDWLLASERRTSWIYGPANISCPSDLSSAAAYIVLMIKRAKIPLIALRCQYSGSAIDALISMIYSIIIQLVQLMPDEFSVDRDLTPALFASLNRSVESLPHALGLMDDLLALIPSPLVIILDGMQPCEDGNRASKLSDTFVAILRDRAGGGGVLKAMYTTDDVCRTMKMKLAPQDEVDVTAEAGGSVAHRRAGRVAMARLVMPVE